MLTLDKLSAGCKGVVVRLDLPEEARRRMAAFGLVPGCIFNLTRIAPLGGPMVLQVGTTRFLLRRSLARSVEVEGGA
ncbi:FeoA family protein [Paludibacterium yongneupense]|uniref:FeoA family protein n=1 Tax=Paludibacterium yongneupense TaxID=400061 RepID=UPI0005673A5C|nr:FeoA family protein [Paludibacterium yongneupense]